MSVTGAQRFPSKSKGIAVLTPVAGEPGAFWSAAGSAAPGRFGHARRAASGLPGSPALERGVAVDTLPPQSKPTFEIHNRSVRSATKGFFSGRRLRGCCSCCALGFALFSIALHCRGSTESLFQDGLEAYQTGQFATAAKEFRESAAMQPAAGTLVNLGVVEWRRGRPGPAILAWEKALWVDAFDQRARDNLRFGRTVAGVDEPRLRWYEVASTWLPTNSWGWITAGGLWLALGMFLLPGILRWRRAGWQQVLAALGLCAFLLSLPAQLGVLTRARVGFVLGKKTPLRLSPTVESETITVLGAGEPVRQLRRRGGYVFVQTENSTGWVEREDIGLICPEKF